MICREWDWKGMTLGAGRWFDPDFQGDPCVGEFGLKDPILHGWGLKGPSPRTLVRVASHPSPWVAVSARPPPFGHPPPPLLYWYFLSFLRYVSVSPYLGWLLVLSTLTSKWLGKSWIA